MDTNPDAYQGFDAATQAVAATVTATQPGAETPVSPVHNTVIDTIENGAEKVLEIAQLAEPVATLFPGAGIVVKGIEAVAAGVEYIADEAKGDVDHAALAAEAISKPIDNDALNARLHRLESVIEEFQPLLHKVFQHFGFV